MEFDVFISYHTKSSTHITEAICNALESKKIKCWYAPRNIAGSYARSIVEAIGRCKIFLLILNKESSYSEDVLNEINLAVERVRKGDNISIIPFHISEEDISPDAKYYLGRMHWVDAINPPMEKRINELVSIIAYILDKNINSNYEYQENQQILKSNHSLSVSNFIGRKSELKELEENLNKYGKVFVKGMGGIGKSELVKKYINDHKDDYNTIVFAVYENSLIDTINKDNYFKITNFTRQINIDGKEESDEVYFKRKLEKIYQITDEKTLIVIDNFDVTEDPNLKDILSGNYHLIFTTRNDFKQYKLPILEVTPMSDMEDLINLFKETYQIRLNDNDILIVKDIIELLGRHTLTVQLIASIMQEMRIRPSSMFEELNGHGINNEIQGEVTHNMQNYDSIFQCLSVLFKISDLTNEEKNILKLLTLFPISGVNFDEFMDLCEINNGLIINKLIKRSLILYNYITDSIALHPLLSNIITEENPLKLDDVRTLIHNIGEKYEDNILIADKETCANVGIKLVKQFKNYDVESALDFIYIALILLKINRKQNTDLCEEIFKKSCELLEQNKDQYTLELAIAYRFYEYLYDNEKIAKDGHPNFFLKTVHLLKGNDKYIEKYAEALKGVAFRYINEEKDSKEARKFIDESFEIYKSFNDPYIFGIGSCYLAYSGIFELENDLEKALEYVNKSYDVFIKIFGVENKSISDVLYVKASIYLNMKNYEKAIKYLKNTLDIRDKYCEKTSAVSLNIKEKIADIYMILKEYKIAKKDLEELYNTIKEKYANSEERILKIQEKIDICNQNLSD